MPSRGEASDAYFIVGCGLLIVPLWLNSTQWGLEAVVAMGVRSAGMSLLAWHAWKNHRLDPTSLTLTIMKWVVLVGAVISVVGGIVALHRLWQMQLVR